jgi:hypothetical protein
MNPLYVRHVRLFPTQSRTQGTWQFMSAELLLKAHDRPPPLPSLQDGLESFFHVLAWVAHRRMPPRKELRCGEFGRLFISMFQHTHSSKGGVMNAGRSKKEFIMFKGVIEDAVIDHPIIPSLMAELTDTMSARYVELPDADIAEYRKLRQQATDPETLAALTNNPVAVYERGAQALSSSDWMLAKFTDAVADRSAWPVGDKAIGGMLYFY